MKSVLALVAVAGIAASANADFNFNIASANSGGAIGSADNSIASGVYGGPSTLFGRVNFSGSLSRVISGTYASEARWHIGNGAGFADLQVTTTNSYTGTISINASAAALVWATAGANFTFESFESYDDGAGADSTWSNAAFSFSDAVTVTHLGNYASGSSFNVDTLGSNYDTELAIYTAAGTLVGTDDDGAGGALSRVNAGALADGTYYIVVGGYNSGFGNGFAFAGAAGGNFNVNINGASVASGAQAAGAFQVYSFTVPTPGSMALLGLGGLAGLRRRSR